LIWLVFTKSEILLMTFVSCVITSRMTFCMEHVASIPMTIFVGVSFSSVYLFRPKRNLMYSS
jgi:hypothetical protein